MATKTSPVPSLRSLRPQKVTNGSKRCNQSLDLSSEKKTTKFLFGAEFLEKTLQTATSPNKRDLPGLRISTRDQINTSPKPNVPYSINHGSQRSSIYEENRDSPSRNRDYRSSRSVSVKKSAIKKPYTGGEIVEKSKELLDSVRTPKEIFSEAIEHNWTRFDDINAPKYGKEKLRQMAKRLDIVVNLDEDSDLYRKCKFMRNIPAKYYHKLKEIKNKKQGKDKLYHEEEQDNAEHKRTPPVFRLNLEEPLGTGLITQVKTTGPIFSSRIGSPMKKNSGRERWGSAKKERPSSRPTGSEITHTEKNLFFANLANYVDVKKSIMLGNKSPYRRAKAMVEGEDDSFSSLMKSDKKKDYMKIWLDKTSEITQDITQYISHDYSKDLVKICQERVDDDVKKIEVKNEKFNQEIDRSDGKPDPDDTKELLEGVKDRNTKVQTLFKGSPVRRRSVSEKNTKMNSRQFFRHLLFKEQKPVDLSVLNALGPKPKTSIIRKAGRDLFNGPADS